MFGECGMDIVLYLLMWAECVVMIMLVYENYKAEKKIERYRNCYRRFCLDEKNHNLRNDGYGQKKRH